MWEAIGSEKEKNLKNKKIIGGFLVAVPICLLIGLQAERDGFIVAVLTWIVAIACAALIRTGIDYLFTE
jgi:hypothetical protein